MKTLYLFLCSNVLFGLLRAQGPDFITVKNEKFWQLVPKNPKIELLATGFKFTEGPLWHPDGYLLFSDIPANTIYKMLPTGTTSVYITPSGNSNGLTFDYEGNLIVCEHSGRRVSSYDKSLNKKVLAESYNGKKLNSPNDVVVAKNGNIYFTDPPYGLKKGDADTAKEQKNNTVFLLKEGELWVVDSTLYRPNGIALSPDEKTLYVAQSEKWLWKAYTLGSNGLPTTNKVFFESAEITGNPDGIKVDSEGNVYATGNKGIVIFDKEGTLLGSIKFPENTTNLAWGDRHFSTLYVTCASSIYKIKMLKKGYK